MLQKRITPLLTLLLVTIFSYAQVNLQTGSANFSLPIFDWKDAKSRLNASVALGYTSGNGLKVNDVASNIGQGWNLAVGGVITRMQVGEPDDQVAYNGDGTEKDIRKFPAGYLYATVPPGNGCPSALARYPIYNARNQVYTQHNSLSQDKQLDYFSFQFNGKAGMFVLNPTTANGDVCSPLGDTKMKISFQRDANLGAQGIRTRITSFTIRDVDGLIYKFTKHGTTKVLEFNYCDPELKQAHTQPKFSGGGVYHQAGFENASYVQPKIIGSWYLTEIEDGLTHRKITFNYYTRTIKTTAGTSLSYNGGGDYTIISHKVSATETPEISSISLPDGHSVVFNYGAERADYAGQYILSSVDITYQSRFVSKHIFNTTYFLLNRYGTPLTAYQKKTARLCLKSVKKIGVDLKEDSPPYTFDYYTGSSTADDFVPPPFFYAKDVWGFYNGSNSTGADNATIPLNTTIDALNNNQLKGLCFRRNGISNIYLNPKSGYAKNGLLRQVIYPTGGTLTYGYEQNNGLINGANLTVGGVHVSQTSSTDGGGSNGCANPLVTQYKFIADAIGTSSLWGLEMPVNATTTSNHYEPEWKRFKWGLQCLLGCCYWQYQYPGILSQNQAVSLSDFQKFMIAAAPVLGVISTITTIMDIVTIACGSTGFLAWVALIVDIIGGLLTLGLTCFSSNSSDKTATVYYDLDLNAASPLPAQFKRVEVVENPGTIGKTIHEFTSSDDYAVWEPSNPAFSAKQRFAPWAYGLPKLITVMDAQGNILKQSQYDYNFFEAQNILNYCFDGHPGHPCNTSGLYTSLVSCKCVVSKSSSQRNTDWADPAKYNLPASYLTQSNDAVTVDFYGMYSGRVILSTTSEKVFKPASTTQYLETKVYYSYNNGDRNYELNEMKTTQSNGDETRKSFRYSSDFSGGLFDILKQNNMLTVSVANEYLWLKDYSTVGYMQENVTEFIQLISGDIKPYRTLEQRATRPQADWFSGNNWVGYNGPGNTDYSKFKVTQLFAYDANSNLIGAKDEGGRTVANIYDYNDNYVVASVLNADPLVDKLAYSSFETATFGGWTFGGGSGVYVANTGVTGVRALNLTSRTLSATGLNTTRSYTLSFWANVPSVIVNGGATLTKSAPSLNGLTYYEYDIAQGTTNVSVSGSAIIDELRLYPKTARMRTSTYDILIGKSAECDENNRLAYFEYDNLGRLKLIKDGDKNILKMYEYNNIALVNGCPVTYYSRMITEFFTRSNCAVNYIGSDVLFTVPANKYTSAISQEDADAKVETDLFANGQAYADANGTCIYVYTNTQQSQNFLTEGCNVGYVGGTVTYTVPAGRYSSTISQADANQKALTEILANGQAFANKTGNAVCSPSTDPDWTWKEGDPSYCYTVNGTLPAHLFVFETDINPNSPTYGQTRWSDVGAQGECPPNLYYNSGVFQYVYKNDCLNGMPLPLLYTVPPGKYSSPVSQAAADQLAMNEVTTLGQAYANANGSCSSGMVDITCVNNTNQPFSISFYNAETDMFYGFYVDGSTTTNILGQIPLGTYQVSILPQSWGVWNFNFSVGSYYMSGVPSFSGTMTLDCNCGDIWISYY
jgi:hypothetical protein